MRPSNPNRRVFSHSNSKSRVEKDWSTFSPISWPGSDEKQCNTGMILVKRSPPAAYWRIFFVEARDFSQLVCLGQVMDSWRFQGGKISLASSCEKCFDRWSDVAHAGTRIHYDYCGWLQLHKLFFWSASINSRNSAARADKTT